MTLNRKALGVAVTSAAIAASIFTAAGTANAALVGEVQVYAGNCYKPDRQSRIQVVAYGQQDTNDVWSLTVGSAYQTLQSGTWKNTTSFVNVQKQIFLSESNTLCLSIDPAYSVADGRFL